MIVINKTTHKILGPPSPGMAKPFVFESGENKVPDLYMKFLLEHRNFKRDVLDPGLIVPAPQNDERASERVSPFSPINVSESDDPE